MIIFSSHSDTLFLRWWIGENENLTQILWRSKCNIKTIRFCFVIHQWHVKCMHLLQEKNIRYFSLLCFRTILFGFSSFFFCYIHITVSSPLAILNHFTAWEKSTFVHGRSGNKSNFFLQIMCCCVCVCIRVCVRLIDVHFWMMRLFDLMIAVYGLLRH